jgi:hypothetical protein
MVPHVDEEILNDEIVIIHPSGSLGKPEIFEPYTSVCLPGVLGDVGGWSKAMWEWRSLDASAKGLWSWAIRARTPIVWSVTMPRVHFTATLDGPARARVAYPRRCPMDVIIMSGLI